MTQRITWPLSLAGGRLVTHEQDSLTDVAQCVHILTRTPLGARPLAPEIGLEDPTGSGADEQDLALLEEWEPRARLQAQVTASDDGTRQVRRISVSLDDPSTAPEVS